MARLKLVLIFVFGLFMIFGGFMHFLNPDMYNPFIPDFMPKVLVNNASGALEIAVGIAAMIPRYRAWGTLGLHALMLAFLPLHVMDVFKENPAIGSHEMALIRLPVQFIFILWAWFIHKK